MAESFCVRLDETPGEDIKTRLDGETHVQTHALDDDSGDQLAILGNPTSISIASMPPIGELESIPTDASKNNPSFSLSYDADGNLTQVDQIVGGTTYRKINTYTVDEIAAASVWVAV